MNILIFLIIKLLNILHQKLYKLINNWNYIVSISLTQQFQSFLAAIQSLTVDIKTKSSKSLSLQRQNLATFIINIENDIKKIPEEHVGIVKVYWRNINSGLSDFNDCLKQDYNEERKRPLLINYLNSVASQIKEVLRYLRSNNF